LRADESIENQSHIKKPGFLGKLLHDVTRLAPDKMEISAPTLTPEEILQTLFGLKNRINGKAFEEFEPAIQQKFIDDAESLGIKILPSIDDSAYLNLTGSVIVLNNTGKNVRLNITNGYLVVLGDIEYGAMIDVRGDSGARHTGKSPPPTSLKGITVVGHVGNHVRLTATHNIIIQDTGDYVQLRSGDIIKSGNIGRGANLMARHSIECGNIGDDLRSTHFATQFSAQNIGARSIIKAGSITVKDIGSGSELIATHNIEADHVDDNCILTARSLLMKSAAPTCQMNAGLMTNEIAADSAKKII